MSEHQQPPRSESAPSTPSSQQPPVAPSPLYGYYPGQYPPFALVPPTLPPTPAQREPSPQAIRLAKLTVTVTLVIVTVAALALAAFAPTFTTRAPSPTSGGLHQVYNSALGNTSTDWQTGNGCAFEQGGLHAQIGSNATLCAFIPSTQSDLTTGGFFLTTTVGPAASVSGLQEPCIALQGSGDEYTLAFDQNGNYLFALDPAQPCELTTLTGSGPETSAWHASGYTTNEIGLRYTATDDTLAVYVNGQQILHTPSGGGLAGQQSIGLGAAGGGEAVFTAFALYSAG